MAASNKIQNNEKYKFFGVIFLKTSIKMLLLANNFGKKKFLNKNFFELKNAKISKFKIPPFDEKIGNLITPF